MHETPADSAENLVAHNAVTAEEVPGDLGTLESVLASLRRRCEVLITSHGRMSRKFLYPPPLSFHTENKSLRGF
ncbi:hypothetical protein NPIL_318451 [Nephila pilipes]|uniref:Uncharacterized protein n=1 Tax=Nephila pilipes TaxID=299642 RepID=A0A8X6T468_NEPPI|nr:hypothetical protein NPIL_318451 [Nephila pilipes]